MKRRLVPVLGSSLVLWAVTASAAVIAPDDNPSLSVALAPVRVVVAALKTMLILTLFTGGLAVDEFVEFHPPASLVEALLYRQ